MNEGKIQLYKIFRAMLLAAAVAVFASALFFTCFSPVKVYAETTSGEESEEPQLYDYRVEDLKIDIVINEKYTLDVREDLSLKAIDFIFLNRYI